MRSLPLNWRFLTLTLAVTLGLFGWGLSRLDIDTDILGALPKTDPVVADGTYLLLHHPMQNQVVVDVALNPADLDILVACGQLVETRLRESGLFKSVGMEDAQALMPELIDYVAANLPVLFSAEELQADVQPLLKPEDIRGRVAEIHAGLLGLESIGQAALIARDPLNLRGLVLKRLAHLVPATDARIDRGHLISADNRHLLVIASPVESSTATEFAALIMERIDAIAAEVNRLHGPSGPGGDPDRGRGLSGRPRQPADHQTGHRPRGDRVDHRDRGAALLRVLPTGDRPFLAVARDGRDHARLLHLFAFSHVHIDSGSRFRGCDHLLQRRSGHRLSALPRPAPGTTREGGLARGVGA